MARKAGQEYRIRITIDSYSVFLYSTEWSQNKRAPTVVTNCKHLQTVKP